MGFTVQDGMVLGAVASNGTLTDFFVEQEIPTGLGKVGNLYKGRVTQVVPTLQAVFVDIGLLRHGFLSMNDVVYDAVERFRGAKRGRRKVEDVFRTGDPVLVQIEKESRGDKGATVTTKISIPGRYVVYMPYGRENHISRQVQGETERNRLRRITNEIELPQGGLILRTAAKDKGKRELAADIGYLTRTWQAVSSGYEQTEGIRLLHAELGIVERTLRDHYHRDIKKVYFTEPWMGANAEHFLSIIAPRRSLKSLLQKVEGREIWKRMHLVEDLERLFRRRTRMPCGGTIIIEEMETLTAIDVNTSRNIAGKSHDETILITNMDAAEEVPRQLRLRQIGGIVVIDFIDMRFKKDRDRVLTILTRHLATQLSTECEHCGGNGRIPSLAFR